MAKKTVKAETANTVPQVTEVEAELTQLEKDKLACDAQLAVLNRLINAEKQPTVEEWNKANDDMKLAVQTYNADFEAGTYERLLATEHPLGSVFTPRNFVMQMLDYKLDKVRTDDGEQIITGASYTTKDKQIDVQKFCKQGKLSTKWVGKAQALNRCMTLRLAGVIGKSAQEQKVIAQNFGMSKEAAEYASGKNPTSNNQIKRILDDILTDLTSDFTEGEPLTSLSKDVAFLQETFARLSNKKILTVRGESNSQLLKVVTQFVYRVVNNLDYDIEYRQKKEKAAKQDKVQNAVKDATASKKAKRVPKADVQATAEEKAA